jgi:hypothetical protein
MTIPTKMEWQYYTNKAKRRKIDELLFQAAMLFANCPPNNKARQVAKLREQEIINEIAKYDTHFATSCGWRNPAEAQ